MNWKYANLLSLRRIADENGGLRMGSEVRENAKPPELAQGYRTESGRPLSEADENEFIIKPDGSRDFGEISETLVTSIKEQSGETMLAGKIRLHVGNSKEGLIHSKFHEKDARQAGYMSVEDMIAHVTKNYDGICICDPKKEGDRPTYSLLKMGDKEKKGGTTPVYMNLENDGHGNYYAVVTTIPMRVRSIIQKIKKERLIYSSPAIDAATASNNSAVSRPSSANVGATQDVRPTSDKSSILSISSVPQQRWKDKMNEEEKQMPMDNEIQRDSEIYHQEISDSLTVAEESLEDNAAKELRSIADDLHTSMKNVEEAEQTCGADQETWDGYAPRHENIIRSIEKAGDAKSEGKSDEECSKAIHEAQESMREGTAYMQERCELILQREKEYQEQIEGLRRRIEELERERELKAQSPEELARCLAVSMEFLAAIDAMRKEAKSQPRIVASEMFTASREAVKDAYYSVKLAPTKIKSYLTNKAHKAIDGVLHSVAGVFDKGIAALEQRRAGILEKSHEIQSATEFYRDAMKQAAEEGKEQGTMEMERHVAKRMAQVGFGAYAIEKTLLAESPHRKEMEKGEARNIAKDSVREREEQREEKSR